MTGRLLLVWTGVPLPDGLGEGPWSAAFALDPTLHLVRSEAGRSPVYHAAKDLLPPGTALVVAPLEQAPKAKGVAPGLATWLRSAT